MTDDDIRTAFGSVFTDEPPLGVHSAEVLRKGRGRLRRRRAALAGGFAAVVAAVVVGGSLLPGPRELVSAARPSPDRAAGPCSTGPESSTAPATLQGSTAPAATTLPVRPCEPTTAEQAQALTGLLTRVGVLPSEFTLRGADDSPVLFVERRGEYLLTADLVAPDGQEGALTVLVGGLSSGDSRPSCQPPATCEFRTVDGETLQITTRPFGSAGEVLTMVYHLSADGSQVYASTSNVSSRASGATGKARTPPSIDHQPLTVDQLVKLVTLPGLEF
ncbi:hypothetical protein [Umezawaea sp. NPDC059074]|uniref:hypothetical protein n=1 Tax=Umezawaea sp. NPDC059074 TaxID=3346716 RepID=UPI00369A8314